MRRLPTLSVFGLVFALVANGCSSTDSSLVDVATDLGTSVEATTVSTESITTLATSVTVVAHDRPLVWTQCAVGDYYDMHRDGECATLTVPLDHDDPSVGTIDLAVVRLLATEPDERIGVLFYDASGPGQSSIRYLNDAVFSAVMIQRFDLVAFDTRGATEGTAVYCGVREAPVSWPDPTPETGEEQAAIAAWHRALAARCAERSGHLLPYMSTVATVRDMDLLREALGEEQISYLGQSYGHVRGSVYATLFPERVRAMVLDGAIDPNDDMDQRLVWDALAQERVLNTALDRCAADPSCAFHSNGDPYTAFDDLMASLDAEPLNVDGTEVGLAEALFAVQIGLYHEEWWPDLMQTLADVRDGDGTWLAEYHGQPGGEVNHADDAVVCLDLDRRSDEIPQSVVEEVLAVAPRLGPYRLGSFDLCSVWPVEPDPPPLATNQAADPILVLGTTGSPFIAIERNRNLVQQLDNAVLLVVERYAKYAYWTTMWDQDKAACVHTAVERHLIDLDPPEHLSVCKVGDPELHPPD